MVNFINNGYFLLGVALLIIATFLKANFPDLGKGLAIIGVLLSLFGMAQHLGNEWKKYQKYKELRK